MRLKQTGSLEAVIHRGGVMQIRIPVHGVVGAPNIGNVEFIIRLDVEVWSMPSTIAKTRPVFGSGEGSISISC